VIGDEVTFHNPGSAEEHESWTRGRIVRTLKRSQQGYDRYSFHLVKCDAHKWDADAPWGDYDGVPLVVGQDKNGAAELDFLGRWELPQHPKISS
jgi:Mlc titration factor MtfA (ptsG expression regulator)